MLLRVERSCSLGRVPSVFMRFHVNLRTQRVMLTANARWMLTVRLFRQICPVCLPAVRL